ncbi:2-phosphosulfolactate phosphatase [Terrabacter sp. MAHUQ-38]|uniref:2-phosphosulfolactate phosphatase n=1 Tax=unclassified Terrabacter TaxID=2630222 RepID=UPI00165D8B33|nr:2-phosphosulfolactate phosphatase [Terrabacter sp. MAHUQ-38]MBC9820900.1 2-phosphosulfolactate phosphatase [Terrabacter sp. MAHUQ-38]
MQPWHSQDRHVVRLDWGPVAAEALTTHAVGAGSPVCAVVVDVLSFTTCVSVAADAGVTVHPYRWRDDSARGFAQERGATLAVPRSQSRSASGTDGGVSLSPASIRAARGLTDLVLPSPNGSTVSALLAGAGAQVVAASLRNRSAVSAWVVDWLQSVRGTPAQPAVVVVPAGERWPDGSLRPAVEDLWGAGAVVAAVASRLEHRAGPLLLSPEAEAAGTAWLAVEDRVAEALDDCASGRELIEQGWSDDVAVAAELDASDVVPVLRDGAYTADVR